MKRSVDDRTERVGPGRRRERSFRWLVAAVGAANLADGIGTIAIPWLASAVTRSPALIALVVATQRLPWLLVSIPAGVAADRFDRRRLMWGADVSRSIAVAALAITVWLSRDELAALAELEDSSTNVVLYALLLAAAVVLGCAEVVRDNAGQTITPMLVAETGLERANGRIWAAERLTNSLLGPAIGSLLLTSAYALPLAIESAAFLIAAGCIASVSPAFGTAHRNTAVGGASLRNEFATGIAAIWQHRELRTMSLALGGLNLAGFIGAATYVLYAQEVLEIGPVTFAIVGFGGAVGGVVGGFVAPGLSDRLGDGRSLAVACFGLVAVAVVVAVVPYWPVILAVSVVEFFCVTLWSVVTLTFRQEIVPAATLGRANGVHRCIGWGAMPIGAALGGLYVGIASDLSSREWALRSVWLVAAGVYLATATIVMRRLTDHALTSARSAR